MRGVRCAEDSAEGSADHARGKAGTREPGAKTEQNEEEAADEDAADEDAADEDAADEDAADEDAADEDAADEDAADEDASDEVTATTAKQAARQNETAPKEARTTGTSRWGRLGEGGRCRSRSRKTRRRKAEKRSQARIDTAQNQVDARDTLATAF
jgi:hypothetical protein